MQYLYLLILYYYSCCYSALACIFTESGSSIVIRGGYFTANWESDNFLSPLIIGTLKENQERGSRALFIVCSGRIFRKSFSLLSTHYCCGDSHSGRPSWKKKNISRIQSKHLVPRYQRATARSSYS